MRTISYGLIVVSTAALIPRCQRPPARTDTAPVHAAPSREVPPVDKAADSNRHTISAQDKPRPPVPNPTDNPTARSGRGRPSLDDFLRPPVWVHIDGQSGNFVEHDGRPQAPWVIENPVQAAPTFRVEVYEPLLGAPTEFRCVVERQAPRADRPVAYALVADAGTFRTGREYPLVEPGEEFTIHNRLTGDVVSRMAPLPAGTYILAAKVKNAETGAEALGITYFTVGQAD